MNASAPVKELVRSVGSPSGGWAGARRVHYSLGFVLFALGFLLTVRNPASAQLCAGDCDGSSSVTVDELVTGVMIGLGSARLRDCPSLDGNVDDTVAVDEIVAAVTNAIHECPSGQLFFDEAHVAMLSGGREMVGVTARDDHGEELDWTVASSAPDVVSAVKEGDAIELTGSSLGSAVITVIMQSETSPLRRSLPVRVYDPLVLNAGEILIRYVDTFECLASSTEYGGASFYRPVVPGPRGWHVSPSSGVVVPEGWQRLGTFGAPMDGCPDIHGQQWMIVVKENPERADPNNPPLVAPASSDPGYPPAYRFIGGFSLPGQGTIQFWRPDCPAGYVAMGYVECSSCPPDIDPHTLRIDYDDLEATCVREDLTIGGVEGERIMDYWAVRTAAPENDIWEATKYYLETGTFSGPDPILNVLAVEPLLLIDTPPSTWQPRIISFDSEDLDYSNEPILSKAILVPFTAMLLGSEYTDKGVGWMVDNSPFVRVERLVHWSLVGRLLNTSTIIQPYQVYLTTGTSIENSESIWASTGLSLTVETGVELLGTGGKVSATVSFELGYERERSVEEFTSRSDVVPVNVAPDKFGATWQKQSVFLVKLHDPNTGGFETILEETFGEYEFLSDDYPDPDQ